VVGGKLWAYLVTLLMMHIKKPIDKILFLNNRFDVIFYLSRPYIFIFNSLNFKKGIIGTVSPYNGKIYKHFYRLTDLAMLQPAAYKALIND